ncbi:MAG TPA: DUF2283 domain-containing protein [Acetobacteraceae bacterium]|nr:DUF2283 domain-containing protein [Acetobacteraceae bacterium]
MKTSYDPEADAFYARFAPERTAVAETQEVAPGVMLDLDADGNLVGVEVLSVRLRAAGAYPVAPPARAAE